MTHGELLQRMSAYELAEWMAFATLEPFGEVAEDIRMGQLVATTLNINRGKRSKPVKLEDVMIDRQTPGQKRRSQADEVKEAWGLGG